MKKFVSILLAISLVAVMLAGCGSSSSSSSGSTDDKTIVVGASPTPHAEILKACEDELKKEGYTLQIKEFTDYVQPNQALTNKEIDANYFQHEPYLKDYNEKNSTDLVSAGAIHYEPMGIFAGKAKSIADLADGAAEDPGGRHRHFPGA